MSLTVLYEDNHLIAVYKPAGTLVQGDATGDATLMDEVKYYLKQKYHKTGKVWLGLLHRLDRPVSGVILFAKTSKGAARISEQIRNHQLAKIYRALVIGKPKKEADTLVHWLRKDGAVNKTAVDELQTADSQRAELSYQLIKANNKFSLLEIILVTGRSHQIRAQLAASGCPIAGDVKYGAPEPLADKSIALAATSLTFKTATTGETITVAAPENWERYL